MTGEPVSTGLRIVQLSAPALAALADGDLAAATRHSGLPLSDFLVSEECVRTWQRRAVQVVTTPADAAWVTGAVVSERAGGSVVVVGRAGFHAAPDADGMVEVGYAIDPGLRRRGFGRATLAALVDRAVAAPEVRVVRASVSPDNVASLAMVAAAGFVQVGEQWDDEDGLELVLERPA